MESRAKYALVGVVVLVLIGLLIGFIMWITDAATSSVYNQYVIYFQSQNLSGLQVNSPVTMKGIKVGSVLSLNISERNIEQVKVVIKVQDSTPVKTDTRAALERNLLTGLATIDLTGSSQKSDFLTAIVDGETFPRIPEGQSRIDAVASSVPEVVNNVSLITNRLSGFLSPENEDSFSKTLKNMEVISAALASEEGNIKGLVQDLKALSADLRDASRSIAGFTKTGDRTLEDLRTDLKESLARVKEILVKVDNASGELAGAVTGSSRVLLQQTESITQSLQDATKKLGVAADQLSDVRGAVFGPNEKNLAPGESLK